MLITIHWKGGKSEKQIIEGDSCSEALRTLATVFNKSLIKNLDFIQCELAGQSKIMPEEIEGGQFYRNTSWKHDMYMKTEYHINMMNRKQALIERVNAKRAAA